jgi:hypothetical protein
MSVAEIQRPLFGSSAASTGEGIRREPRQEVVRHVEYSPYPRARSDQGVRVGFTRDLSHSGMCVRLDTPERVGSLLRVTLREVDGQARFVRIERIAWSSPGRPLPAETRTAPADSRSPRAPSGQLRKGCLAAA